MWVWSWWIEDIFAEDIIIDLLIITQDLLDCIIKYVCDLLIGVKADLDDVDEFIDVI